MREWLFSFQGLLSVYLLGVNLLAAAMMAWDKRRSKAEGARRIPERRFFLVAVLGGSLGAVWGMFHFHHKTRHWYFRYGLPAILLLQCLVPVIVWYLRRG